jgi:hypothetical protein
MTSVLGGASLKPVVGGYERMPVGATGEITGAAFRLK